MYWSVAFIWTLWHFDPAFLMLFAWWEFCFLQIFGFDSDDIKEAYFWLCFLSDIGFEIPDKFVVGYALVSLSTII